MTAFISSLQSFSQYLSPGDTAPHICQLIPEWISAVLCHMTEEIRCSSLKIAEYVDSDGERRLALEDSRACGGFLQWGLFQH